MNTLTRQVRIETPHWLKRKVIYFGKEMEHFFPSDALGDREKEGSALAPQHGHKVTFDYCGVEKSECDIAVKRNKKGDVLQMRPRLSAPIGNFYKAHNAAIGDFVTITKVNSRTFEVRLVKADDATV